MLLIEAAMLFERSQHWRAWGFHTGHKAGTIVITMSLQVGNHVLRCVKKPRLRCA